MYINYVFISITFELIYFFLTTILHKLKLSLNSSLRPSLVSNLLLKVFNIFSDGSLN